jgi:hypothetical protein
MKKKLNIDSITNELEGSSLFFTRSVSPPPSPEPKKIVNTSPDSPISVEPVVLKKKPEKSTKPKESKSVKSSNDDTVIPRHHDTMTPRYQDTTTPQIHGVPIEQIRKAVKEFGKEAATHRFTVAEKKEIADLIYTYKNRGLKTSENEIARVSVNFIVEDYKVNGENSVLHKILKALNE